LHTENTKEKALDLQQIKGLNFGGLGRNRKILYFLRPDSLPYTVFFLGTPLGTPDVRV
jgi:hypothetical protein